MQKRSYRFLYYYKILLFTAEMYGASLRYMIPFPFPPLRFHSSGFTYLLLPFCQFLFKCESWYSGFLVSCEDCDVAMHRKSSEIRWEWIFFRQWTFFSAFSWASKQFIQNIQVFYLLMQHVRNMICDWSAFVSIVI